MTDLKPCPFCGSINVRAHPNAVDCKDCSATGPDLGHVGPNYYDCADAVQLWNTRPDKTAILAAMEECAKVCEEIEAAFDKEWRAGLKACQHLQGLGDGASDCVMAIRAKISQMKGEQR